MVHYIEVTGVPVGPHADGIVALAGRVLPRDRPLDLEARLGAVRDAWGLVALVDDQVVGFKLGYCDRPGRFYSWLGGVAPECRRQGIGAELLRRQHDRCRDAGYARIRTNTTNAAKPMLLLNLHGGFDIVGTTAVPGREMKIILERAL